VTVAAPVRYMTASVMSLTVETLPIGDRLVITSFGVWRWSGVSTTPGATAFTRMPSFTFFGKNEDDNYGVRLFSILARLSTNTPLFR
jgi:hypothetical protein